MKNVRVSLARPGTNVLDLLNEEAKRLSVEIVKGKKASSLSADAEYSKRAAVMTLEELTALLQKEFHMEGQKAFLLLKSEFDKQTADLKKQAEDAGKKLSNVFAFCEEVFGDDSQEILILVTELTISYHGTKFISRYGCKEYFAHNKELLFYERQKEIIAEIEKLEL